MKLELSGRYDEGYVYAMFERLCHNKRQAGAHILKHTFADIIKDVKMQGGLPAILDRMFCKLPRGFEIDSLI